MPKAGRSGIGTWPQQWRREIHGGSRYTVEDHDVWRDGASWVAVCPAHGEGIPPLRLGTTLRDAIPTFGEHLAVCEHGRKTAEELPEIPSGAYRLTFDEPMFTSVGGTWHLVGPDWTLPVGKIVTVYSVQRGIGRVPRVILVGAHVAQRVVHHQPGSYTSLTRGAASTRYVLARIDKGDNR